MINMKFSGLCLILSGKILAARFYTIGFIHTNILILWFVLGIPILVPKFVPSAKKVKS